MSHQGANLDIGKIKTDRAIIDQRLELGFETVAVTGAVSVATPVTLLATTATAALTLAAGYTGQVKIIVMTTDGGTATLTPASYGNGTTIVFDDVYDMWMGIYVLGAWYNLGTPTATCS